MNEEPLDILVVEDEPAHAEAVRRAFADAEPPVSVRVVDSLQAFRKAVAERPPSLVLLDLLLPDGRAEVELVAPPESGPFPMIVMTSHGDEEVAVSAIRRGALDYVVKSPETFANMPRTVDRTLRAWRSMRETRSAQEALRVSEARFRETLDAMMEGCQIIGFDWRYRYVNPAVARQGHSTVEALLGRTMMEVYPGIENSPLFPALRECMERRKPQQLENEFVYPDGSRGWFELLIQPVGEGIFILSMDITGRKRAEAALHESQQRLQMALDAARMGAWEYDFATQRLYWSPEIFSILGLPAFEPSRARMLEMMHPDDVDVSQSAMDRAIETHTAYHCEYRVVVGGRIVWLEDCGQVIRDAEGRPRKAVGTAQDVTARRQAEVELRAREEIYASIISQSDAAITVFDAASGQFVEFNAAAHDGLGYTRDEFARLSIADFQADHSPEAIRANIAAVRDQNGISFMSRHRRRDGTLRDVRVSVRPLRVRSHDYMAAVWTDITDRRKSEARAERESVRTRFLLDLHQRASQMSDRELFEHVMERAVRMTASAMGFFHQVSEDQRSIILTTWNQEALKTCTAAYDTHYPLDQAGNWVDCVRQRRPVVYNDYANSPNRRGLPDGHAPVHRFMSIPIVTDGKVRIIFGVGNKATDYDDEDVAQLEVVANELHKLMTQRAAQCLLRESEERFRQLVETTADMIWETDAAGRFTYVSPRSQSLFGQPPEDVVGRTPFEFMSPADGERIEAVFRDFASRREPFSNLESVVVHKDGRRVYLETSGAPVVGADGSLQGYRGVDRDITGRRRLEEQLWQAQKLEAVGLLAGGVAHDFNNILSAIMMQIGFLEIAPSLDADSRQIVKDLGGEARRAAGLTRQLLMFSRRSVMETRVLDVNEVVKNLLRMLGRLIGENIRLSLDVGAGFLPPVDGDAGMLEQVIMNMVVNARDAMPKGGRVTISTSAATLGADASATSPDRRPGRFVCVSVSDTGVGMDEATLKRIFEPFFTTKEPGKGTGLGLATVHGIVAQHKGWVEVESEVGAGTTFRVYLPAAAGHETPRAEDRPDEPARRGEETILLVEDEEGLRVSMARAMRALGYVVHEAANGQQAVRLWQEHGARIDLLLTDMVMPEGMTGLELAEHLQALKPGLKVIVSSGYSKDLMRAGGITQTGIRYLPKPYPTGTLAETIRACLDSEK